MRARNLGAAGIALALAWSGAACAVIPTQGSPVPVGAAVQGDPLRKPYVRVIAMPPRPEWRPEQVVTGFLAAMASVDDPRWSVARQYLTPDAGHLWRPEAGVTVYEGQLPDAITVTPDAKEITVPLKGTVIGTIDTTGKYHATSAPDGQPLDQPFKLVKGPQGWRITEFPDGLLLNADDIRRSYRAVKLYYLDNQQKGLVVDEVRIRVDPSTDFAESIVNRLLDGATTGLKDAVHNAVPAGTTLHRVSTDDDKIIVDLNEAATNAISTGPGGGSVAAMAAQIGWTLDQLTERWDIEIRVNGEPFYPDGGTLEVGYNTYRAFDPWLVPGKTPAYYLKGGTLQMLHEDDEHVAAVPVPASTDRLGDDYDDFALSGLGPYKLAALHKDHKVISVAPLVQGAQWQQTIAGTSLLRPCWDRYDNLWTVDKLGEHSSRVLRYDGKQVVQVSAPSLEGVDVRELRVARDGVRVAAVVDGEHGTQVLVGTVVVKGSEVRISNFQPFVTAGDGEIKDIAWRDATTLLVLTGGRAGQEVRAVSVTDGTSESFKADARITSITALGDSILAGAEDAADGKREVLRWEAAKSAWVAAAKDDATYPLLPLG
ncbi:hypothetical protein Misp01_04580 [Microtetraspora sp. NBRC 13810]|uniref:LpqB family beta-propeller domain-containing protein n=1 Tax=Microtetraspora sp. NBRC 13810 TaxID=3030990 RepID=UPI0024A13F19|nr:LpqB family beta-propeller domain-containing protein [Microtetraspora sp. NBRC 13810]GLW05328.1 hypothetical protein Misp01_04580 [Microtetraspora sp. NBRC 13810]